MNNLDINNPYNAPVFHEETVSSTMDVSRQLAADNAPHGTVITADLQESGRGRIQGRKWEMERGNLPFTIILRYPRLEEIPEAITLRAGLAVSLAIEDFAPSLKGKVFVKWPNDIIIDSKKAAGILCEANDGVVHLGIGLNAAQREFPEHLRGKAISVAIAANKEPLSDNGKKEMRWLLLEKILLRLYDELENKRYAKCWKERLEQRLYKKGEQVVFAQGAAGSGREVRGLLAGIGEDGELLILPDGESEARGFFSGEIGFAAILSNSQFH